MPLPAIEKEVRGLLGRLQYINRFIEQLTPIYEPIFKLLKKNAQISWSDKCQATFDKIKQLLIKPPILVPPTLGRHLFLYLSTMQHFMCAVLGQHDESGCKERAIYYLSKKFNDDEARYSTIEKV